MPTIFITGTSSGLGHATAKLFASKGWQVIATMTTPTTDSDLAQLPNVMVLALDVTRPEQVDAAVAQALQLGPVDVVFNNAGYAIGGPLELTTDEQIAAEFDTNVFGVMRVTRAFTPHFRSRGQGLFLTTTSMVGLVSQPFLSVYSSSKWALEGWSESLAFELRRFGIGVKTIVPGAMATNFMQRALQSQPASSAYDAPLQQLLQAMSVTFQQSSSPEEVAAVVYEAATDGKAQLRYLAGPDAHSQLALRTSLGAEALHQEMDRQIFG